VSLRPRVPAAGEPPSIAWADTLETLAEVHRLRRAADDTARWPLAHACSHRPRTANVGGISEAVEANDLGSAGHAFCCRALA
jgi:hypothetical protein